MQSRTARLVLSCVPNALILKSPALDLVIPHCTQIIFLNPGMDICATNCRNRPWEPHKYGSPEEQDANLDMLLAWVEQYSQRTDEFSLRAHRKIFDSYAGEKVEYTSNDRQEGDDSW